MFNYCDLIEQNPWTDEALELGRKMVAEAPPFNDGSEHYYRLGLYLPGARYTGIELVGDINDSYMLGLLSMHQQIARYMFQALQQPSGVEMPFMAPFRVPSPTVPVHRTWKRRRLARTA